MPARSSDLFALVLLLALAGCGPYDVFADGRDLGCETERWTCGADSAVHTGTKLEWERVGPSGDLEWEAAKRRCESLLLDGEGWRLPTLPELKTIREGALSPRLDLGVFPGAPGGWYWAGEEFNVFTAAAVDFASADESDARRKTERAFVRCVR